MSTAIRKKRSKGMARLERQAEGYEEMYQIVVVFERSLSDDVGVNEDQAGESRLPEAMLQQFCAELQQGFYEEYGSAGFYKPSHIVMRRKDGTMETVLVSTQPEREVESENNLYSERTLEIERIQAAAREGEVRPYAGDRLWCAMTGD